MIYPIFFAKKPQTILKKRKSLEGLVTVRFFEIKSDVHVYNEIT